MSKQSNECEKSIIEISPERKVDSYDFSKLYKPVVMANALILAISPVTKAPLLTFSNEKAYIKHDESALTLLYPTVRFEDEDGRILNHSRNECTGKQTVNLEIDEIKEATLDITFQQVIGDLRRENMVLKNRLLNSLPIHTIYYMVGSSIVGAIAVTLIFLRFVANIYTLDPYYLICALIICLTLFFTALVSLKDWKEFLNER